jgi:hypothetical protein
MRRIVDLWIKGASNARGQCELTENNPISPSTGCLFGEATKSRLTISEPSLTVDKLNPDALKGGISGGNGLFLLLRRESSRVCSNVVKVGLGCG